MIDNNTEMFKGSGGKLMSLNDLFTDIYTNSKTKASDLKEAINTAMSKIQDTGDVVMLMPMIRDLYEVGVRNDDQLVRLAAIIQKYITSKEKMEGAVKNSSGDYTITEEEKKQLLSSLEEVYESDYRLIEEKIQEESDNIEKEINDASE